MAENGSETPIQRQRRALLALLAADGERGLSRDRLIALLWPERSAHSARHNLEQLLYLLRRQLHEDLFLGTDPLRLNPRVITSDVGDFHRALADRADADAVALYRGPFLAGFYIGQGGEFQEWVDNERAHLAGAHAAALTRLAEQSARTGDLEGAVAHWQRLVALDALNSRNLLGLVRSLAQAGDRASALRVAQNYEALIREELDISSEPALQAFMAELRTPSNPATKSLPRLNTSSLANTPADVGSTEPSQSNDSNENLYLEMGQDVWADKPIIAGAGDPPGESVPEARHTRVATRRRRWAAWTALSVLAAAILIPAFRKENPAAPDHDAVVVIPFRVSGADSTLFHLGEAMVELLALKLTGEGGPRAVDASVTVAALRKLGADPTPAQIARVAQRLGAQRVLQGAVIGNAHRVTLMASLHLATDTSAALRATVTGPYDSIPSLADQLAAQLLIGQSGGAGRELASMTSLSALRAYLEGRTASREGRWKEAVLHFERALSFDSTFAPGASGLQRASLMVDASGYLRAERLAWQFRDRLNPRDRALLLANLGPNYPAFQPAAERLRGLRALVDADPHFGEAWRTLGEAYLGQGSMLGVATSLVEARIAFERALDLDSIGAGDVLESLVGIATVTGDTALLRRISPAAMASDTSNTREVWYRWLAAFTARDSIALENVRPLMGKFGNGQLFFVLNQTQLTGYDLRSAATAQLALSNRPGNLRERSWISGWAYNLALNRGRPGDADAAAAGMLLEWDLRSRHVIQLVSALYDDGDAAAGRAALHFLSQLADAPVARNTRVGQAQLESTCAVQQWRVAQGDTSSARAAIALLSTADSLPYWWVSTLQTCAAMLDTWLAVRASTPDAGKRLERLDSLMLSGPAWHWLLPRHRLLAALWAERSEWKRAHTAIRRRRQEITHLAGDLRQEGRFAALAGDTAAAIRAYRHYLALRFDPEPALRPQLDSVRAQLQSLLRH